MKLICFVRCLRAVCTSNRSVRFGCAPVIPSAQGRNEAALLSSEAAYFSFLIATPVIAGGGGARNAEDAAAQARGGPSYLARFRAGIVAGWWEAIMATEWSVRAVHLGNCNCAYGCPCKFSALPTNGHCRSAIAYEMKEGYFGSIRLDGLRAVLITSWPGAIHEGKGTMR